jgi:hypothetical protein
MHKPPRTTQHRFNNFFQYGGQPQRKSNSKLAGVPSQAQYQPQNSSVITGPGATGMGLQPGNNLPAGSLPNDAAPSGTA